MRLVDNWEVVCVCVCVYLQLIPVFFLNFPCFYVFDHMVQFATADCEQLTLL